MRVVLLTAAACLVGVSANAALIDGALGGGEYGAPLSVQTINTQFGDNQTELNAAYAEVNGGTLSLLVTGNIQSNGNRLYLFLDTVAGGSTTLPAGKSNYDLQQVENEVLEISPEYLVAVHEQFGAFQVDVIDIAADTADILVLSGNPDSGTAVGSGGGYAAAWTNANTLGVGAGAGEPDGNALTATTGFELSIALPNIGSPATDIQVTAIGSSPDGFFSNQVLGSLPDNTGNLGNGGFDLQSVDEDQFFTISIPEPSAIACLSLVGLGLLGRRRDS